MTPLTAFLTARLDELEARALRWPEDSPTLAPDGHFWRDTLGHPIYAPRSFVLADIASKRAIVDLLEDRARMALEDDEPLGSWSLDVQNAVAVLRILAEPFAAHPDFEFVWMVKP